ncbi:MAG: ABC transporter ATP-binding protein, partial [Pseudomonadota bacterium]
MENSIFRYILRYSTPQQIYVILVTVASYPFLFMSLELPKIIVNEAIDGSGPPFEFRLMGLSTDVSITQIQFLLTLSFTYLFLVFMNGAFKYHINVYKGQLGERLLRRLRYQLYERMLRFPLPRFRKVGQGEVIPIITAEVEPLGGFIGTAYADPMFYGGQLVIILSFIVLQDPWLGLAAIAFYPLQIYLIPKLQRHVNRLAKRRIQNIRRLSDHIGESVSGIAEIRANDTSPLEMARFTQRLGRIYDIRFEIFRRKFFIKFLNNFIDKLTPFFFFSIGGYLVIHGDLTLGALIAVLAAYKDLAAPWKEMLVWYQQKEDTKIKYEQVIELFSPDGMEPAASGIDGDVTSIRLDGETSVNVTLVDEDGVRRLDGAAITVPAESHTAVVGDVACGKADLAMVLAGLQHPTHGKVVVGGHDIATLPWAVVGHRIGYVGSHTHLNNVSVGENLIYGLKNRLPAIGGAAPGEADAGKQAERLDEALKAGNSPFDYGADWIDYAAAGVDGPEALRRRLIEVLGIVELDGDVYAMGLRGSIDPDMHAETARKILQARTVMRDRMSDPAVASLVEPFDKDRYNGNATVGENLLFGAPLDRRFDMERLPEHPYVRRVLDETGLTEDFIEIGRRVAETMIELFADLPPNHEFFQQYSFIAAEDLPVYRDTVMQASRPDGLSEEERQR